MKVNGTFYRTLRTSWQAVSATPDKTMTRIGLILNRTSKINAPAKMHTERRFNALMLGEKPPRPQKAVTRMLTPAAPIMATTAGRRDFRTPWMMLKSRYFR